MEKKPTLPFSKITKNSVDLAGGKGTSLGEMTRLFGGQAHANPIPPGFVITSAAFYEFIKQGDMNVEIAAILDSVNPENIKSVEHSSRQIRSIIMSTEMPEDLKKEIEVDFQNLETPLVAVRSSATAEDSKSASWAGELETYLNTDKDSLLENVKKCWSSLFTPRAIFYAFEKGIYTKKGNITKAKKIKCDDFDSVNGVSVAVVVQTMVQSEVSGICFTVHPVTKDSNQMIIEAGWGLGEAIVSGQVTPDNYVIDKDDNCILDINVNTQERMIVKKGKETKMSPVPESEQSKQKMSGAKIMELAEICMKIEKHYGFPCDIEWAMVDGKIYITQSRPITTL